MKFLDFLSVKEHLRERRMDGNEQVNQLPVAAEKPQILSDKVGQLREFLPTQSRFLWK